MEKTDPVDHLLTDKRNKGFRYVLGSNCLILYSLQHYYIPHITRQRPNKTFFGKKVLWENITIIQDAEKIDHAAPAENND